MVSQQRGGVYRAKDAATAWLIYERPRMTRRSETRPISSGDSTSSYGPASRLRVTSDANVDRPSAVCGLIPPEAYADSY